MLRIRYAVAVALTILASSVPLPAGAAIPRPKLFLVLVIDQFRADTLLRFESRFIPPGTDAKPGGFRYLMTRGAYFPFAQYGALQSTTGPGHATILSGAHTGEHGIAGNEWWDAANHRRASCVDGGSPQYFRGSTVGDELKNSGLPSKVVTVALKDRSAIFLGGHRADLAVWFDPKPFQWVSSAKYLKGQPLPGWVNGLNAAIASRKGKGLNWKIDGAGTGFSEPAGAHGAVRVSEKDVKVGSFETQIFPMGATMTVDAALAALQAHGLGKGAGPDLLGVSFSGHDYLAHAAGQNTREVEELTVFEDKELARLLGAVAAQVPGGLKNVVIALTADHGGPPSVQYSLDGGTPAAYLDDVAWGKELDARLDAKFGKASVPWVPYVYDFRFTIDSRAVADRKADVAAVEAEAKAFLAAKPGIVHVITDSEARAGKFPHGLAGEQAARSWVFGRTGSVLAIPAPFHMNLPFSPGGTDHSTGYAYDRTVPLIIASGRGNPWIKPGQHSTRAMVVDLASTLSYLAGVMPPATSVGRVLSEAIAFEGKPRP